MACCLFGYSSSSSSSSSPSSSSASASSRIINNIRVVDLNGFVEEFDHPVRVSQLTDGNKPPKDFVFTAAQLLSTSCLKPLTPETILEPGRIYFLMPYSAFGNELSPVDLAGIVKRLTAKAKAAKRSEGNNDCNCNNPPARKRLLRNPDRPSSSSPAWNSTPAAVVRSQSRMMANGKRSWRPILDTIREMSFRRSLSDLQDVHV